MKLGFWARCTCYIYRHKSDIYRPQKSDVPLVLLHIWTCIYATYIHLHICHQYRYSYVKDTHMHGYDINTWYVYLYDICICIYVHMLPTCIYTNLHKRASLPQRLGGSEARSWRLHVYMWYLHSYNTYIYVGHMDIRMWHIDMWHIDMWCICIYRDMTYTHVWLYVTHVYEYCIYGSYVHIYIYTCLTYVHMHMWHRYICYMCTNEYSHITW